MIGLIDVNVLVAIVLHIHEHHTRAQRWLDEEGDRDGWATCALTELGAIRICAQLPVQKEPRATAEAILLLHEASKAHVFWPDTVSPATMADVRSASTAKQVSDRYRKGIGPGVGRLYPRGRHGRVSGRFDLPGFDEAASTPGGEQTSRHPRGVSVSRLRVDLLAVSAKGLDDGLSAGPVSRSSA